MPNDLWVRYTPSYPPGNRESESPIRVEIRPMSAREQKRKILEATASRLGTMSERDIVEAAIKREEEMFLSHVRGVENYKPFGQDVTTADALLEYGAPPLVREITNAIEDHSRLERGVLEG